MFFTGCSEKWSCGHWSFDVVLHWRMHWQRWHHWLWCLNFLDFSFSQALYAEPTARILGTNKQMSIIKKKYCLLSTGLLCMMDYWSFLNLQVALVISVYTYITRLNEESVEKSCVEFHLDANLWQLHSCVYNQIPFITSILAHIINLPTGLRFSNTA